MEKLWQLLPQPDSKSSSHAFCYYHPPHDRFPGWNSSSCNALLPPSPGTSVFSESLKAESECDQKEKVVIAGNHTIPSMTEVFLNGNIDFQWKIWDFYEQFLNFLVRTLSVSPSIFKKNIFNQNSTSARKIWGLGVLLCFSLQCADAALKEKTWQNCFESCWTFREYFYRGRTRINCSFSHLSKSLSHGNLFPTHSTSSAVLPPILKGMKYLL